LACHSAADFNRHIFQYAPLCLVGLADLFGFSIDSQSESQEFGAIHQFTFTACFNYAVYFRTLGSLKYPHETSYRHSCL